MTEKINELSEYIAGFIHEFDPVEFSAENSDGRAEALADALAQYLVDNGIV